MASLYRKRNSPFWFVQFVDGSGKRRNRSTELRADDPGETSRPVLFAQQLEAKELSRPAAHLVRAGFWVPAFLEPALRSQGRTTVTWTPEMARPLAPNQTLHSAGGRSLPPTPLSSLIGELVQKRTGKRVGRNTAILELKILA